MELNSIDQLTLPRVQKDMFDSLNRWKKFALASCVYIDRSTHISMTFSDSTVSGDIYEAWDKKYILYKIDLRNTDITPEFIQNVVTESIIKYKNKTIKKKLDDIKKDFE